MRANACPPAPPHPSLAEQLAPGLRRGGGDPPQSTSELVPASASWTLGGIRIPSPVSGPKNHRHACQHHHRDRHEPRTWETREGRAHALGAPRHGQGCLPGGLTPSSCTASPPLCSLLPAPCTLASAPLPLRPLHRGCWRPPHPNPHSVASVGACCGPARWSPQVQVHRGTLPGQCS